MSNIKNYTSQKDIRTTEHDAPPDRYKQKEIKEELRESEEMFKIVVDSSPLAIYLAEGIEQKAGYVNPKFTELFGYTINDVPTAEHWFSLAYPDPKYRKSLVEEWKRRIIEAQRTGRPTKPLEGIATCKDGSKKHVQWSFVSVGQKNISYGLDLTEIKKLEEEHKKIDEAKSGFVSLASHQLRTPLSAIKWYSKMLMDIDKGRLSVRQIEYLGEIQRSNERMIALVNALLNFSRVEMGTFTIQPKMIDIVSICKEVIAGVNEKVLNKGLKIEEKFPQIMSFMADQNLIHIIFHNLITNAVKYTPNEGKITVSISKNETDLLISVKDTGYGIPEEEKGKVFSKLFRAANITTKETEGTGLGLYITKSIIEQSANGKIWFESEENKGTTFYVSLPLKGMVERSGTVSLQ